MNEHMIAPFPRIPHMYSRICLSFHRAGFPQDDVIRALDQTVFPPALK